MKFDIAGEWRGEVWWPAETSSFGCWVFDGDRHIFDPGGCRLLVSGEGGCERLGSSGGRGGNGFI